MDLNLMLTAYSGKDILSSANNSDFRTMVLSSLANFCQLAFILSSYNQNRVGSITILLVPLY